MEPNYAGFWAAFKSTNAWIGLMSMSRYSEAVELRTLRMRVEMLDAINGNPNQSDIQEAIWRLVELTGSSAQETQLQELVGLLVLYGFTPTYSLLPADPATL
jgi:hypothetical protein